MIYRGYAINASFPPGSGPVTVHKDDKLVKTFPYTTTDEEVMDWVDSEKRKERK